MKYRSLPTKLINSMDKHRILLIISILLINIFSLTAQNGDKISLKIENATYSQIFQAVEKKTKYVFFYNDEISNQAQKLNVNESNLTIDELLSAILKNSDLTYKIVDEVIVITNKTSVPEKSEKKTIKGKVTSSADDQPMPGVNVVEAGTLNGTVTDADGRYTLTVFSADAKLSFSFIGFLTEELNVSGKSEIDVALVENISTLSEVVVIGYGSQKKRTVIGSISTIDMKDFGSKSAGAFDAGLQGRAGGVSVQSQSGSPGAPSIIKIRGANTIRSGTDPLWIIDGMPVYSSPSGLGSSGLNPMSLINPNDIESIQVLKDAAATSIYGSRASNGVIIVTTKNGKKGESSVSFSYSSGVSSLTRTTDDVGYTNTEEWFKVMDAAYQNSTGEDFAMNDYYRFSPQATTILTREQAMSTNTDWYNEVFRNGTFSDFNLSSSQGFEKGTLFISANYRKDKGVQNFNDLSRYTIRSNITVNPTKNLTLGIKLTFSANNNNKRNSGITSLITYTLPWFPVYEPDNSSLYFNPYTGNNPAASNDPENKYNNVKQYRGLGNLYLNFQLPVEGLTFKTELSADFLQSNSVNWESRNIWLNGAQKPTARATEEAVAYNSLNYNAYLSFDRSFGLHNFNIVTGAETTRSSQYSRNLRGEGLIGKYQEIGTPNVMTQMYGGLNNERYLLGYFGRANYGFKDRYLLGISLRRDGTSAFTESYRWGTFLAFSAGWVLSDEEFMSFLGESTFLKLRGSYGETGNQNVQSGLDVVNYNGSLVFGSQSIQGVNGTMPINLAVGDLTWESTKSSDFGLDFGFLENRINGSFAYYHRMVYDMLLPAPVPVSAGVFGGPYDFETNSIMSNIGNLVNSGLELEFHSVNININNFRWTTDFNISFNKNVIQSLTPEADQGGKGLVNETTASRKDNIRGEWFIADYAGVDRATGVPMIYALDKEEYDLTGNTIRLKNVSGIDSLINATTTNIRGNRFYQVGKSADPKYYGGITNTFIFKGFDFGFMFAFSGGNYILDYDRQLAAVPSETRVLLKELYDNSWKQVGDVAKYPLLTARGTFIIGGVANSDFGDSYVYHNRELYKGDFIRLRNVTLGYTIPGKVASKIKMQNIRVYLNATNLLTFTQYPGFDPEGAGLVFYSNAIPQVKSFIIGLNLNF